MTFHTLTVRPTKTRRTLLISYCVSHSLPNVFDFLVYTVGLPLSAVHGLSRLTKLTTSERQARPIRFENFRIGQSLSNRIARPIRIGIES